MSILNGVKILKDLDESELLSFEVFCQERFISKWEVLFNEWDEVNSMYLLKQWKIEIFTNKDNKEIILWYIEAEDILWEMAIFWNTHNRTASARVIEDSVIIVLLEFSIQELTKNHPEILEKIKEIIKKREEDNEKIV